MVSVAGNYGVGSMRHDAGKGDNEANDRRQWCWWQATISPVAGDNAPRVGSAKRSAEALDTRSLPIYSLLSNTLPQHLYYISHK